MRFVGEGSSLGSLPTLSNSASASWSYAMCPRKSVRSAEKSGSPMMSPVNLRISSTRPGRNADRWKSWPCSHRQPDVPGHPPALARTTHAPPFPTPSPESNRGASWHYMVRHSGAGLSGNTADAVFRSSPHRRARSARSAPPRGEPLLGGKLGLGGARRSDPTLASGSGWLVLNNRARSLVVRYSASSTEDRQESVSCPVARLWVPPAIVESTRPRVPGSSPLPPARLSLASLLRTRG